MTDSKKSKADYNKLRQQRESLGDSPKCPKCKTVMGESVLVPYFLVCPKCEKLWPPSLSEQFPLIGSEPS